MIGGSEKAFQEDAGAAAAWLIDRMSRLSPGLKLSSRAVMTLDEYGTYERLSLPKPTVELNQTSQEPI